MNHSNSSDCANCHTNALRPNWNPYFFWQGAYGSEEDSYIVGGKEEVEIQKLLPTLSRRLRYRRLIEPEAIFKPDYIIEGATSRIDAQSKVRKLSAEPNRALLALLAQVNIDRISKHLIRQKNYDRDRFLIASILSGCVIDSEGKPKSEWFSRIRSKDQRLAALLKVDSETVKLLGGFSEMTRAGYIGALAYVNKTLRLEMDIDIEELGTFFYGKEMEAFPEYKEVNAVVNYFNDGTPDYSPMVVLRGLAFQDEAFKGLEQFACSDDLKIEMVGREIKSYTFCGLAYDDDRGFTSAGQDDTCAQLISRWQ